MCSDVFRGGAGDVDPVDPYRPGGGFHQPGDDVEQGRLAASARADDGDELAAVSVQSQPPQHAGDSVRRGVVLVDADDFQSSGHRGTARVGKEQANRSITDISPMS